MFDAVPRATPSSASTGPESRTVAEPQDLAVPVTVVTDTDSDESSDETHGEGHEASEQGARLAPDDLPEVAEAS